MTSNQGGGMRAHRVNHSSEFLHGTRPGVEAYDPISFPSTRQWPGECRDVLYFIHLLCGSRGRRAVPLDRVSVFCCAFRRGSRLAYVCLAAFLTPARPPSINFRGDGSPSLFWNNSVRNNVLFLRFLLSAKWRELGDPEVGTVVLGLRWLIVIYFILSVLCVVLVFRYGSL
jgi:hypothetical protein